MKKNLLIVLAALAGNLILGLIYPEMPAWALAIFGGVLYSFLTCFSLLTEILKILEGEDHDK